MGAFQTFLTLTYSEKYISYPNPFKHRHIHAEPKHTFYSAYPHYLLSDIFHSILCL